MDTNGTLEIPGGHTTVVGPLQGDTAALDYDKTGVIIGGTFIGTGSTIMAQSFSDSEQGVIALHVGSSLFFWLNQSEPLAMPGGEKSFSGEQRNKKNPSIVYKWFADHASTIERDSN